VPEAARDDRVPEDAGQGEHDKSGKLVTPGELEDVRAEQDGGARERRQGSGQGKLPVGRARPADACAGPAGSPPAPPAENQQRAERTGHRHDREQRAGRVTAIELVVVQEDRQWLDRYRAAAAVELPRAGHVLVGDTGRVVGIGRLELPARDRRNDRAAVPGEREQPDRVTGHRQRDRKRLLAEDAEPEAVRGLLDRHAGRRLIGPVGAVRVVDDLVDAERLDRRRRAE
jgi:hypothetical protein